MQVFFVKRTFLENNLYKSDAVSHQKKKNFNEDWSEFFECDQNKLLGSNVSYTESGNPARTKD